MERPVQVNVIYKILTFGRFVNRKIIYLEVSTNAYECWAYIRWELCDGSFCSKLLSTKNKLAPMRQTTIPRLELCGAISSSRSSEDGLWIWIYYSYYCFCNSYTPDL